MVTALKGLFPSRTLTDWKLESDNKHLNLLGHAVVSFRDKLWVVGGNDIFRIFGRHFLQPGWKKMEQK